MLRLLVLDIDQLHGMLILRVVESRQHFDLHITLPAYTLHPSD